MREEQGNIFLQNAAERPADLKKSQQQPGLIFVDKRPREYAALMLIELRKFWKAYQEEHVPEKYREMVSKHIITAIVKSRYRKK